MRLTDPDTPVIEMPPPWRTTSSNGQQLVLALRTSVRYGHAKLTGRTQGEPMTIVEPVGHRDASVEAGERAIGILVSLRAHQRVELPERLRERLFALRPDEMDLSPPPPEVDAIRNAYDLVLLVLHLMGPLAPRQLRGVLNAAGRPLDSELIDSAVVATINDGVVESVRQDGHLLALTLSDDA